MPRSLQTRLKFLNKSPIKQVEYYNKGSCMKKMFKYLSVFLLPLLVASCGEELVTKGTNQDSITTQGIVTMSSESCGGFHYEKPPVDILFVIDNSGSTNNNRFEQIRAQIGNTIATVSQDFDYHIYIAPLFPDINESITSYPLLIAGSPSTVPGYASNITNIESLNLSSLPAFAPRGNNNEKGIDRTRELLNGNKGTNKVFRPNSNLVAVMISTEDDNSFCEPGLGMCDHPLSQTELSNKIEALYNVKASLNSPIFRFISLVPFSNCAPSFRTGKYYRQVSQNFYSRQGLTDDYTSFKDSRDLCSGNYSTLFQAVNNSIQKVLVGHTYGHWAINPNDVAINENNIDLKKRLANGNFVQLSQSGSNGFELLSGSQGTNTGYRINFDILESPSNKHELKTGLIVKLNGNAKVTYPECIIAKTISPTEYYGYVVLNRKPDLSTVRVVINGSEVPQSTTNGWSSHYNNQYMDTINIKIIGPNNATPPVYNYNGASPAINKSGYVLKLHGSAVYSNSDTIQVFYKAADIE